jgi:hypothetical protein
MEQFQLRGKNSACAGAFQLLRGRTAYRERCLWVLWVVRHRSLRRADHPSGGFLQSVVCVCVWVWSWSLDSEEALAD